jgi:hypothetical protein
MVEGLILPESMARAAQQEVGLPQNMLTTYSAATSANISEEKRQAEAPAPQSYFSASNSKVMALPRTT